MFPGRMKLLLRKEIRYFLIGGKVLLKVNILVRDILGHDKYAVYIWHEDH